MSLEASPWTGNLPGGSQLCPRLSSPELWTSWLSYYHTKQSRAAQLHNNSSYDCGLQFFCDIKILLCFRYLNAWKGVLAPESTCIEKIKIVEEFSSVSLQYRPHWQNHEVWNIFCTEREPYYLDSNRIWAISSILLKQLTWKEFLDLKFGTSSVPKGNPTT